ncbi:MAG: hypothetical protein M0023_04205 [Desulfobacteraceae bacterium]|nr:hypothetical protein [Desulfobacteraceae bacterium]
MRISTRCSGVVIAAFAGPVEVIGFIRSRRNNLAALLLLIVIIVPFPVRAQNIHLLGGMLQNADDGKRSYSWQLEYIEELGENLGLGVTYLNEGHVPDHHRDGNAIQLWAHTGLPDRRLSLAAGIGPYYFYDTLPADSVHGYSNDHGWGMIFSSAVTWEMDSRWLLQLRGNWVESFDNFDSISVLAGIGYHFEESSATLPSTRPSSPAGGNVNSAITLYAGQTIVNSLNSQKSVALAVEYRRRLLPHVDWTATWLYEGDNRLMRRNGLASELWAVREFLDDRLSFGLGGGVYFPVNERHVVNTSRISRIICGIVTLTSSYQVMPSWDVRVSWNRVITDYDSDTDVILGGIGYRF